MRYLQTNQASGFTLVEILVISPIVILFIGAFVGLIVGLTGDSLRLREQNSTAYDVQSSLDDIEANAGRSTGFLSTTGALQNKQGKDDATAAFSSTNSGAPDSLIFTSVATDKSPFDSTRSIVYQGTTPCNTNNPAYTYTTVYFVGSDATLYRRQILSSSPACLSPYQRSTCSAAVMSASPPTYCMAKDDRLIANVSAMTVTYYTGSTQTADPTQADTIKVSITATKTVAGRSVAYSGDVRLVSTNAGSNPPQTAPSPNASGYIDSTAPDNFICQWDPIGSATGYNVTYTLGNGGTPQNGPQNTTATSFTINVSSYRNQPVSCQVTAIIPTGNYTYPLVTLSPIPLWTLASYQNSWTDYNSAYPSASFTKTSSGMVVLRGTVKGGTSGTIFTLPPGYRPASNLLFETISYNAGYSFGRIDVGSDGTVSMFLGTNAYISLDNINFMPASFASSFTAATFSNGWKNYSTPTWTGAGYMQDSVGRLRTQGLISTGTTTDPTPAFSIPTSLQPSALEHIAAVNSNSAGQIGNYPGYGIEAKGGGSNYVEANTLTYPGNSGWTTLTLNNSWTWYGSYSAPRFIKSSDGLVMLKGLIKRTSAPAVDSIVATLPGNLGLCPSQRLIMAVDSHTTWGRIDILPGTQSGGCTVNIEQTGDASNYLWTSLDNISWVGEI